MMWTPPSVWKYQILNEASCGWDVLNSPLQLFKGILYGGHQTPDNLMVFDFKMPPALFLCWAQIFRRFHPQTALNHRKSPLTHCADTHTHMVETQVKVEALQGFFSLFCKHESEWGSFMLNHYAVFIPPVLWQHDSQASQMWLWGLPDIKELL